MNISKLMIALVFLGVLGNYGCAEHDLQSSESEDVVAPNNGDEHDDFDPWDRGDRDEPNQDDQDDTPEPEPMFGPTCSEDAGDGWRCGGDEIEGSDPDTLYMCNGEGPAGLGQNCGSGCVETHDGTDHHCQPDVAICDSDAKTGYYCAGDKVTGGTEGTLYFCQGPGMAMPSEVCDEGCIVAPAGQDDHCAAMSATCDSDAKVGDYCAGEKVSGGEPGTLYRCDGPGTARVKERCANGCVVAPPGSDDYCRASVTCTADANTGDYCGGNKVSGGKANTLYRCNGPGSATNPRACSNGCVVAPPGQNDYCASSQTATCGATAKTGYYCNGSKVSGGKANTLYYCDGPGPAAVAQACSSSCVVAPAGQDDYCQGSSNSTYNLPYKCNTTLTCSNGNNTSSHTGTDRYAYDFAMPVGTSVRAMRGGTVHRVRNVSPPGSRCYNGGGSSCANYANTVEVRHSDGTIGLYMHLSRISVSNGQRINQGQEVGKSGNSGWSTGPHTHVQVQSNCGIWWCQSKPFRFGERSSISAGSRVTSKNSCP